MARPEALILQGDGINCDNETAYGFELAGFSTRRVHVSTFVEDQGACTGVKLLALPGGFSFGDEIASGKVLALKLREKTMDRLYQFIADGNLVIGICNGFQVLTQLGILPRSLPKARRFVTLTKNHHGHFQDRWVDLEVDGSGGDERGGGFFNGLKHIELPIRHGEGRLVIGTGEDRESNQVQNQDQDKEQEQLRAEVRACAPLRYRQDVNGSYDRIAALTNAEGTVLGLMPHPEAFVRWTQHPSWTTLKIKRPELATTQNPLDLDIADRPQGFTILRNAFEMV